MKLINRILNETTCEGETLDIYIKPAHDHDMPDWKKAGTHQYCVVLLSQWNFLSKRTTMEIFVQGNRNGIFCTRKDAP